MSAGTVSGIRPLPTSLRLIGYVRVSTLKQATDKSYGLAAQAAHLTRWAKAEGHQLLAVVPEVASTRNPERMYGRLAVEAALKAGIADAMAVRDIDRATRSVDDKVDLLRRATTESWRIVGAEGTDTADPEQEFLINIRAAMAQEERRKISRRTREGLEVARASGKQLGNPNRVSKTVARKIVSLRMRDGLSPQRIAQTLDSQKVPTPNGGKRWSHSVVRAVLAREGVS